MNFLDPRLPPRFWRMVVPEPNSGCWLWIGFADRAGYGRINCGSRIDKTKAPRQAHRFAYEGMIGPIGDGLHLDHLCRTPPCCNPAHLEPVTPGENARRGLTGAHKKAKTHCPQGHLYGGDNLVMQLNRRGERVRVCRECRQTSYDKYRDKIKAALARFGQ